MQSASFIQPRAQFSSAKPKFAGNFNVLVAEDEKATRNIYQRIFGATSKNPEMKVRIGGDTFTTTTVENGNQAIAALLEKDYDIVFSDIQMGAGPNGQDVLNFTRSHDYPHAKRPDVILVSSDGAEAEIRAMGSGAKGFIHKPATRDGMLGFLQKFLDDRATRLSTTPSGSAPSGTPSSLTSTVKHALPPGEAGAGDDTKAPSATTSVTTADVPEAGSSHPAVSSSSPSTRAEALEIKINKLKGKDDDA